MNKKYFIFYIMLSVLFLVPRMGIAQEHEDHENHQEHDEREGRDAHKEPDGHEGHDDHEEEGLKVSSDMQIIIGMTFEKVQLRPYFQKIRVYGEIAQDTDKSTHMTSEVDGVVEEVFVQTGRIVDLDEPVLSILKADGSSETLVAPHHGTVMALHVQAKDKVDNLRSLVSLTNLDFLRVSFDVYEKDLRFVHVGQIINIYTTAYPDHAFKGKVVYVSPRIDKHTQTIKIRAEVENQDHLLRLGMFVTGDLIFLPGDKVLSVTQTAVQQIGEEHVVFIAEGESFEEKDVVIGREFSNFVEIKSGLHQGEVIVANGSFALKSEMQKGAFGDGHNH